MKKDGKDAVRRLKSVILSDKTGGDTNFLGVLRSDLTVLLDNYLDLKAPPEIRLEVDEDGVYIIKIKAEADRIKTIKTVS